MLTTNTISTILEGFEYFETEIGDITPIWSEHLQHDGIIKRSLNEISSSAGELIVTDRFVTSLCSKFGIGTNFFKLFTPSEVFERIQDTQPRTAIRITTQRGPDKKIALAASTPTKPLVDSDTLNNAIHSLLRNDEECVKDISYANGIVRTIHKMGAFWEINNDVFKQEFVLDTPIDGYGRPSVYLAVLREVCTNGMISYAPTYRHDITLGKRTDSVDEAIVRAIEAFDNEEGFMTLRNRLRIAQRSMASLNEVHKLREKLKRGFNFDMDLVGLDGEEANPQQRKVVARFDELIGDIATMYDIASIESVTAKKKRVLKMGCTVYDLLNFVSEITTHHMGVIKDANQLHSWVGDMVSHEFDLEETNEEPFESRAFYLN